LFSNDILHRYRGETTVWATKVITT
jgi:hypothetical protein